MNLARLIFLPDGRWFLPSELRYVLVDMDQWPEGQPLPEIAILTDEDLETVLRDYTQTHQGNHDAGK